MLWQSRATLGAFSPPDLSSPSQPANWDASAAKPASMSWLEWCDPPAADEMDVPLTNRSLALMRDTPWLQMRHLGGDERRRRRVAHHLVEPTARHIYLVGTS